MQDRNSSCKSELSIECVRSKVRIVKPSSPSNSELVVQAVSCSNV